MRRFVERGVPTIGRVTRFVALLRGVNLGPNKRIAMADLRRIVDELGYGNVATYVQSGNAVFDATGAAATHEQRIEMAIQDDLALSTKVLVRTGAELKAIVKANPFAAQAKRDPTKVHVGFLSAQAPKAKFAAVDVASFAPDEVTVGKRVLYLHLPDGMAGSRIKVDWRKALGVEITVRNWRTVENLAKLANP